MARKPHWLAGKVRVLIFADAVCGEEFSLFVGFFEPSAVQAITSGIDAIGLMLAAHPEHDLAEVWISTTAIGPRGNVLMRSHDVPEAWKLAEQRAAPHWSHATQGNA
jgi:hypothetical protein